MYLPKCKTKFTVSKKIIFFFFYFINWTAAGANWKIQISKKNLISNFYFSILKWCLFFTKIFSEKIKFENSSDFFIFFSKISKFSIMREFNFFPLSLTYFFSNYQIFHLETKKSLKIKDEIEKSNISGFKDYFSISK